MRKYVTILFLSLLAAYSPRSHAQSLAYAYPVLSFPLHLNGQKAEMAYMDVQPEKPNGSSVILFHGKNFNGFYWKTVIEALADAGYRVIAPDQIGWGQSSKPNMKYTFEMLAHNNKLLLDSLGIKKVDVIGHSMGGMLATRFALMYPKMVTKMVLEDPLGLEDYRKFIPAQSMDSLYKNELKGSYASYKKYQESYYPTWKPEYEIYVKAQAEALHQKDFPAVAYVNALTWKMIYEQPVLYEFKNLAMPVLLIVGEKDRTILGKELISKQQQRLHGNFPLLAGKAASQMKDAKVTIVPGAGHISHIQKSDLFNKDVLEFLK